ncbi:MAG: hypothetical protein ACRC8W_04460 [Plesiomonas shigelloides]
MRLFGKPELRGRRRLGVALCNASTTDSAIHTAKQAADSICVNA